MSRILIVDASTICRELLGKALEAKGMTVSYAATTVAADQCILTVVPDVIILDPAVDQGDGMSWLHALRANSNTRRIDTIILTDAASKVMILRAGQLGVRGYMLKQRFSLPELLGRIQNINTQRLSPPPEFHPAAPGLPSPAPQRSGALPQLAARLTREQTLEKIDKCKEAKTLPGVITELMGLVNSPRGAISEVAQTLKRDPVLAARVLQLANSAAFASQKARVTTLEEATRNIGTSGIRAMILSAGIFELFSAEGPAALELLRFWQHSFAVAAVMERLVPVSEAAPQGWAHLVGLCHDLAELSLSQQFPEEVSAARELSRQSGERLAQARSRVFGMPHHDLVTAVLSKLGLPPTIITPIAEVVESDERKGPSEVRGELARALRVANAYANGLMLPGGADAVITPVTMTEFRNIMKGAEAPQLDDQALRSEALTMVNVLSGVPSRLIGQLCQQPIEKSETRIWYARHPVYSELDPLAAFLRLVANVEVHNRPPTTLAELECCDMVCIADPRHENPLPAQQQLGAMLRLMSGTSKPLVYFSGVDPQLLSAPPRGRCEKLPVQLPILIEVFKDCTSAVHESAAA